MNAQNTYRILRNRSRYDNICINADRTKAEREKSKELGAQIRDLKTSDMK